VGLSEEEAKQAMSTNIPAKVEERHREAARRFLSAYCDMLEAHSSLPMNREAHYNKLAIEFANAERDALERAAKIAEDYANGKQGAKANTIAAAIRALKYNDVKIAK
jgi:GrpB-like predicted nucleotidyltransferase (UPF0157 family)